MGGRFGSIIFHRFEHKAIVEALSIKDSEAASYQVANHIKNLWHGLQTYLDISDDSVKDIEKQIGAMFPNNQNIMK